MFGEETIDINEINDILTDKYRIKIIYEDEQFKIVSCDDN